MARTPEMMMGAKAKIPVDWSAYLPAGTEATADPALVRKMEKAAPRPVRSSLLADIFLL